MLRQKPVESLRVGPHLGSAVDTPIFHLQFFKFDFSEVASLKYVKILEQIELIGHFLNSTQYCLFRFFYSTLFINTGSNS